MLAPGSSGARARLAKWLLTHQTEAGLFTTVSTLVDSLTDNPAAKLTAREIAERLRLAEQRAAGGKAAAAA